MENKTPMQDLLADLKETKISAFETLNEINDKHVRECCQEVVTKTLDCIIERIETELLPKEKQVIENAFNDCIKAKFNNSVIDMKFKVSEKMYKTGKDYYNQKFRKDE